MYLKHQLKTLLYFRDLAKVLTIIVFNKELFGNKPVVIQQEVDRNLKKIDAIFMPNGYR